MVNPAFRSSLIIGGWVVSVPVIVGASIAMGANLSTTALLLALGVAPAIVVAVLAHGAPSPSVSQMLHSVEAKKRV